MINDIAEKNFDYLWKQFDNYLNDYGGASFRIDPLKEYFSSDFAKSLTKETAASNFHGQINKWSEIIRKESLVEYYDRIFGPGPLFIFETPRYNGSFSEIQWFIPKAYYNIACIVINRKAIEELIFYAIQYRKPKSTGDDLRLRKKCLNSLGKLLSLSNAFLSAEWTKDLISTAVSNDDKDFFQVISKSINKNDFENKEETIKTWLSTFLLWYLGGKDIYPRIEFHWYLRQKDLITSKMEIESFHAMLSNLGLTRT